MAVDIRFLEMLLSILVKVDYLSPGSLMLV